MSELNNKAVDIKGKKYVLVSDRVLFFNETYKEGCIQTELLSKPDDDMVVMKALVYPEGIGGRYFTGYSQATWGEGYINKTSALENCETSAVGRALGFMGIGVIESIASVDEINKAQTQPAKAPKIDSKTAFENAKKDIENSTMIEELNQVGVRILKSQSLNEDQKEELSFIANEKMLELKKVETINLD